MIDFIHTCLIGAGALLVILTVLVLIYFFIDFYDYNPQKKVTGESD